MAAAEFDIRGVDDEEARETLARVLRLGRFSGLEAPVFGECDPIWDDLTDLPTFDRELKKGGVEMVWAEVCFTPLSWLRLQAGASAAAAGATTAEGFLAEPLMREEAVAAMVGEIRAGDRELPKPVLELDRQGNIRPFQEGRTRGVAAHYADVSLMPALVFLNPEKDDGAPALQDDVPDEFVLGGHLDANEPAEGFREEVVKEARRAVIRRLSRADELADALREHTGEDVSVTVFGNATPAGDPRVAVDFKWAGSPVSSSIEIDREGRIRDAIVRYPSLASASPSDWRAMQRVDAELEESFPRIDFISGYVGGRDNTRPHVQFFGMLAIAGNVIDFLEAAEAAIEEEL